MPEIPSKHASVLPTRPALAIRQLMVPLTAPPYDDEREGSASGRNDGALARGPTTPRRPERPGPEPARPWPGDQAPAQPRDPDSGDWPGQFAQILAETLAGSRPAHQLLPWTTEQARRRIRQLAPILATGQRPRVRRVMTSAPASGVLELTAVVGFGPRVRVLALRLERDHSGTGRWCCTAIDSA
jgi:hypothetical protein